MNILVRIFVAILDFFVIKNKKKLPFLVLMIMNGVGIVHFYINI